MKRAVAASSSHQHASSASPPPLLDQRTSHTPTHTAQQPRHRHGHVDVRQQQGGAGGPEVPGPASKQVSLPFPSPLRPPPPSLPPASLIFASPQPHTNSATTPLSQSSPLLSSGTLARTLFGSRVAGLPTDTYSSSSSRRSFMSQGGAGTGEGNVRLKRGVDGRQEDGRIIAVHPVLTPLSIPSLTPHQPSRSRRRGSPQRGRRRRQQEQERYVCSYIFPCMFCLRSDENNVDVNVGDGT